MNPARSRVRLLRPPHLPPLRPSGGGECLRQVENHTRHVSGRCPPDSHAVGHSAKHEEHLREMVKFEARAEPVVVEARGHVSVYAPLVVVALRRIASGTAGQHVLFRSWAAPRIWLPVGSPLAPHPVKKGADVLCTAEQLTAVRVTHPSARRRVGVANRTTLDRLPHGIDWKNTVLNRTDYGARLLGERLELALDFRGSAHEVLVRAVSRDHKRVRMEQAQSNHITDPNELVT
mmetsp:Transcript_22800/g.53989  ORF Transcript_22800/g.53989 Transcript_22800/m.53989 type:complete len:233 (-) Transcript_22800:516-1214(-)